MKGKWLLISASIILLAIAAGALNRLRQQQAPPPKQQPVPTEAPKPGDEIAIMGKIQAAHITPIPAPVDGYLEAWDIEARKSPKANSSAIYRASSPSISIRLGPNQGWAPASTPQILCECVQIRAPVPRQSFT